MTISSVSNSSVQSALVSQSRAESKVEGKKPDGDGDQDDVKSVSTSAQASNTAQVTEVLGNNLNVTA